MSNIKNGFNSFNMLMKKSLIVRIQISASFLDKKTIVFDLDETLVRAQRELFPDGTYDGVVSFNEPANNNMGSFSQKSYLVTLRYFSLISIFIRSTLNFVPILKRSLLRSNNTMSWYCSLQLKSIMQFKSSRPSKVSSISTTFFQGSSASTFSSTKFT